MYEKFNASKCKTSSSTLFISFLQFNILTFVYYVYDFRNSNVVRFWQLSPMLLSFVLYVKLVFALSLCILFLGFIHKTKCLLHLLAKNMNENESVL